MGRIVGRIGVEPMSLAERRALDAAKKQLREGRPVTALSILMIYVASIGRAA